MNGDLGFQCRVYFVVYRCRWFAERRVYNVNRGIGIFRDSKWRCRNHCCDRLSDVSITKNHRYKIFPSIYKNLYIWRTITIRKHSTGGFILAELSLKRCESSMYSEPLELDTIWGRPWFNPKSIYLCVEVSMHPFGIYVIDNCVLL